MVTMKRLLPLLSALMMSTIGYCADSSETTYKIKTSHFGKIEYSLNLTLGTGHYKGYGGSLTLPPGLDLDSASTGIPCFICISTGIKYQPVGIIFNQEYLAPVGQGLLFAKNQHLYYHELLVHYTAYANDILSPITPFFSRRWYHEYVGIVSSEPQTTLCEGRYSYNDYAMGLLFKKTICDKLYINITLGKDLFHTEATDIKAILGFPATSKHYTEKEAVSYYPFGLSFRTRYIKGHPQLFMLSLSTGLF